jgi:ELWxxDGT repeat protein
VPSLILGEGSEPTNFVACGNSLYFTATSAATGRELWKTDGTAAGTVLVKDIWTGIYGSSPSSLTVVGSTLYFTANDVVNGRELWKTDGTVAGTVLVKDIFSGGVGSGPSRMAAIGNTLYFSATGSEASGRELWKTDGTDAGTTLVKDIFPGKPSSSPANLTPIGNTLYFFADDGVNGRELWKSDGTATGTVFMKDLHTGSTDFRQPKYDEYGVPNGYTIQRIPNYSEPVGFASMRGLVYFAILPAVYVQGGLFRYDPQLWKTDGTTAGTELILNRGGLSPIALGDAVYVSANFSDRGWELCKSDGTSAGTVLVKDINVGGANASPHELTAVGSGLYFSATNAANGRELWQTDGTAAGTVLVKDIRSGSLDSSPASLTAVGNTLYFSADDGVNGRGLWVLQTAATPPSAPTALVGTPGNGQVSLSWTAPASNGGSAISDYVVQFKTASATTWTTFADGTSTATSAVVNGLTNGTAYVFQVAAVNSAGTGAYSTSSSTITPIAPVSAPGVPTALVGTPGNGRVSLSWSAPSSDGGAAITDYAVRYSPDNGATWVRFNDGISQATSATVTGLTNGIAYVFKISAINVAGPGTPSPNSPPVTPRTTPLEPTAISGTPGNGQVSLTWTAPSSNGGAAITDYSIRYSADNGATWVRFNDGISPATSATVTGLTNGIPYVFKVSAINVAGPGIPSANSPPVTPRSTPLEPTAITGTPGNGQVSLTWSTPASNGGAAITDYEVQVSSNNGLTWTTFSDGVSANTAATVTGLTNGTAYVFKVRAMNSAGPGNFSTNSSPITPRTVPAVPTGLKVTAGKRSATVAWTAPTNNGGSRIADYVIQYSRNNGTSWTTFSDAISISTSALVTGLSPGVSYVFRVAAINDAGTGAFTAKSSAVVPRA